MSVPVVTDDYSQLKHQSRPRPLSEAERALMSALLQVFAKGNHDFALAVASLNDNNVARPSGAPGPWSLAVLEEELQRINSALDEAYAQDGFGA